jgi:hypothetical protein
VSATLTGVDGISNMRTLNFRLTIRQMMGLVVIAA